MKRPIVQAPHPVLASPAAEVTQFGPRLRELIRDMTDTLIACTKPKGVGLAAPQIGIGLQVFIMKPTDSSRVRAFVNPEITEISPPDKEPSDRKNGALEGCLSVARLWGTVQRSGSLTLAYQDEHGERHTERFRGFPAVIVQHECDHLKGMLFTQRVVEQGRKLYQLVLDHNGKEVMEELDV